MFERYTEKARRVIFFARYEASSFGAPAIEPEHILLGLLREDQTLSVRFLSPNISISAVRKEIESRTLLREKISTSVELPLAPEAKAVLAYAHEESDRLEDRHIGTEHLLLGLLREERSMAAEILYNYGIRIQTARDKIKRSKIEKPALSLPEFDPKANEVDLFGYGLAKVPEEIKKLKQLRKINLAANNLTELPEFLGHLSHLEYLDASRNSLNALPDSLLSLKSLKTLYLHDNPGLGIPAEILGPHPSMNEPSRSEPNRILEYYYRVRSARGRQSLNEAKLILVGRGAVGKTSIVNRLLYDVFRREKRTDGIQITKWNLRLNGNELVRLNIWDFGGQEILHATHQFFLTCRSLYLLVLTGREGNEDADAEYWLKLIESFGEEAPVIVVLNKSKEYPFDVNRRALTQKYPNIRGFVRTDCKDRTGLKELRRAIEKETNLLEHLRMAFPENWFAIKEQLALMKTNYLSFNDYREQCAIFGEKDASAQEALSYYLHNLGIALNYRDDPRLQDTYVLNPHWVTNGIYSILSSEKLKENQGEIHLRDLSEILPAEHYPVKMHRFLMDLMKKFELCFTFPDDDCHFLVPELLDKQEPAEGTNFKPLECLNFQYHYPVLHEGLLPRFIVRTHVLSEGYPRWRTGVVLSFEGNLALVRADIQDKRVFIFVSGPPLGRRRLLAIIRSDFEHIHNEIRTLRPTGMVALPEYPNVLIPYEKLLAMESSGFDVLPELADGKVIKVSVNTLLNGVDLEGARVKEILTNEPLSAIRVMCCYSRKDERLREELDTHLKLMHRQGLITTWHDRNIDAGEDWKQSIDDNLERADIILLLVSSDFIASDYCYATEMKRALEKHRNGEAVVIPLIVRDVNLSIAPIKEIQCLPRDGRPITLWDDRDSAWRDVSEGIQKVVEKLLKKKANLE